MQLFISRFWGFRPEVHPVITFSSATYRDKLLRESKPGDRIAYVATKNDYSEEHERGRLLGMAEIGRRAVDTLDVVDPKTIPERDWENGQLRFPKAVPMVRAWRFTATPLLLDVIERQLPRSATSGAILVRPRDAEAILAQPHVPVTLPELDALRRERDVADRLAAMQPSRGPPQSPGTRSFEVPERDFGYVYAFRFGQRNVWKVGNSYSPERRAEGLNRNIPSTVTGECWTVFEQQRTPSPDLAHQIEQRALRALTEAGRSLGGEMFECEPAVLREVWRRVVVGALMGD